MIDCSMWEEPVNPYWHVNETQFRRWCANHGVEPKTERDVKILLRAMEGGFKGRKLSKALYKVRHPEKYAEQKRRWKQRHRKKSL